MKISFFYEIAFKRKYSNGFFFFRIYGFYGANTASKVKLGI